MNLEMSSTSTTHKVKSHRLPVGPEAAPEWDVAMSEAQVRGGDAEMDRGAVSAHNAPAKVVSEPVAQLSSSATPTSFTRTSLKEITLQVTPGTRPYLTGDMATVVKGLADLALDAANSSKVEITEISIDLRYPSKRRRRNPVVWLELKTGPTVHPKQALALWDAVGFGVDRWKTRLGPGLRRLLEERVGYSVEWVEVNISSTRESDADPAP